MKRLITFLLLSAVCTFLFTNCDTAGSMSSQTKYRVSVRAFPADAGTVSPESGTYKKGTKLHISASPINNNWKFDFWMGDYVGQDSSATVTVTSSLNIIAHFSRREQPKKKKNPFAGGDGSKTNPYQVSTIKQLQAISRFAGGHYYFIQINDIDASATQHWKQGYFSKGFKPIKSKKGYFSGTYNGQGYTISNLTISWPHSDDVGLFAIVSDSSTIKNVVLRNVHVTGVNQVGAIAGLVRGNQTSRGRIISVSVVGNSRISGGPDYTGGLVGVNEGIITKSHFAGKVVNRIGFYVGGIAGANSGIIEQSYVEGEIVANPYRRAPGSVYVGGISGLNFSGGIIRNSYSKVKIKARKAIGGIVGYNEGKANSKTKIIATFSTGILNGGGRHVVGGIVGVNGGITIIRNNYWDVQTTRQTKGVGKGRSPGMTGLKTSQMTGPTARKYMNGFDFAKIWRTTNGYPELRWQKNSGLNQERNKTAEPKQLRDRRKESLCGLNLNSH